MRRGQERVPHRDAESERRDQRQPGDGRRGRGEAAPPPGGGENQREQDTELRLVDEEAEQHAGEQRPAVEVHQCGADQGGGEEAVVAVTEIDEHGRKGEREDEPERIGHCPCIASATPTALSPCFRGRGGEGVR
jgi:hypothetical protein